MTPKEIARELVSKFSLYSNRPGHAIMSARICVDEIIKANPTETVDGALFTIHPVNGMVKVDNTEYWQQVKQELKNM